MPEECSYSYLFDIFVNFFLMLSHRNCVSSLYLETSGLYLEAESLEFM